MEVSSLKKSLEEILGCDEVTLELYLISKENEITFSSISDEASGSLLKLFKESISDTLLNDENEYRLKSIDSANDEDAKTYYYFDSENVYEKISHLANFDSEGHDTFSFKDTSFSDIETFIIKIGTSEKNILLYKKNYPINLLKRGKTLFFKQSDENIDELKEDILKIDRNFQFLVLNEHILVIKLDMLESSLGYESVIVKKAEEALATIGAIDFLDDISKLEEMVKSKKIAKKVNLVKNSPVINIIRDNQSKVISFIENHPELKKSLKFGEDGKLELKSKVSVEKFLKLLDDDYLKSELTDLLYDSLNKDKI
ncbi:MAG: DUF4868 domain-containing protein [Campylobacterales bacterium]|nr:DUF4868 domain-containing protein [Campylobacterales bacterium]